MTGRTPDEDENAWWTRLGKLDLEGALRTAGASATSISAVLKLVDSAGDEISSEVLAIMAGELDVDDGKCLLLAVLGRGVSHIKKLFLGMEGDQFVLQENEARALCLNLASSPNVKWVDLTHQKVFGTPHGCTLLSNALKTNADLTELCVPFINMGPEALKSLMDGVKENTTLERLDIGCNLLGDAGISCVAEMLSSNINLKILQLHQTSCGILGMKRIASALTENTSLQKLTIGTNPCEEEGMKSLLRPFIQDGAGQKNKTLRNLEFMHMNRTHFSVSSVASVIRTNKSLSKLNIRGVQLYPEHWVEQIIPALRENNTLKCLDISGCGGLTVASVFDDLMALITTSSTGLEEILLHETHMSVKAGQINEELRVNKEYRSGLREEMILVKPESGRLVLCGFEYAGKSSICQTMRQIDTGGASHSRHWKLVWKNFKKSHPAVRQFLYGKDDYKELEDRTRGFEIVVLEKEPQKTFIWDFAGQKVYYVLHDYLFPDTKNSVFIYVCSARCPPNAQNTGHGKIKDQADIEKEFLFWMQFIASNSKPFQDADGQRQLPKVSFVLSKKDTLDDRQREELAAHARFIVDVLRRKFRNVIALSSTVTFVDGHCVKDVGDLLTRVSLELSQILVQPTEYAVCKDVRTVLESWKFKNPSRLLLTLAEFEIMCTKRAVSSNRTAQILNSKEGRHRILAYFNDVGEIIFPKGLDFIIVDPRWFGAAVLGSLINAFGAAQEPQNTTVKWTGVCGCLKTSKQKKPHVLAHHQGFVSPEEMDRLLTKSLQTLSAKYSIEMDSLTSNQFTDLMIHLEICFKEEAEKQEPAAEKEESENEGPDRLFVPALFDNEVTDVDVVAIMKGRRELHWRNPALADSVCFMGRRLQCEKVDLTFLTPGFFPRLQVVLRKFLEEKKFLQGRPEDKLYKWDRNLIFFNHNGMEVFVEYSGDIGYFVDILVKSSKPCEETLKFIDKNLVQKIVDFCASPQGCQGVQLGQAIIRPGCVQNLHPCASRQAVLVTDLNHHMTGEYGQSYEHTWPSIDGLVDKNFALDLLEGEGSLYKWIAATQVDQPALSGPSRNDLDASKAEHVQLPKHFYFTIDDIGIFRRFDAKMNLARWMPIRIRLMCDGIDHTPHEIEGQSGKIIKLSTLSDGNNLPIVKYAVLLALTGLRIAATIAGLGFVVDGIAPLEKFQNWFDRQEISYTIPMIVEIMKHDVVPSTVPKEEILKCLNEYMKRDPHTEWLTTVLDLHEMKEVLPDFQLWRVQDKSTGQIGWLCKKHFVEFEKVWRV